ncbi:MAG: DUF975 family protein [Minisyncoccia bacterium]
MKTISVRDSIMFGWETFKKRPWFLIGAVLIVVVISALLSVLTDERPEGAMSILVAIAALVINVFIEMGLVSFALKGEHDVTKLSFMDLWHSNSFWYYVGAKILTGIIVIIGLVLLIVPGVIAALALIFATYLIIDRNMGPIEAMKESVRITKGHRWQLFLLALALLGLNILGALALMIGLLVTVPVSLFTLAHVYRALSHTSAVAAA